MAVVVGKIEVKDPELAERIRRQTASGEAWIEAGGVCYVVARARFDLTHPEESAMALDAAKPTKGPVCRPGDAWPRLAALRANLGQ